MTKEQLQEAAEARYPYPDWTEISMRDQMLTRHTIDSKREAFITGWESCSGYTATYELPNVVKAITDRIDEKHRKKGIGDSYLGIAKTEIEYLQNKLFRNA